MIKIELESNTVAEMEETLKSLLETFVGTAPVVPAAPAKVAAPVKAAAKPTPEPTPEPTPKATPKPTPKAAPKPTPAPEQEPEPTTEPEDDDLGLPEPAQEYKLEDAVAVAQDLVAKGKSAEVRKALNAVAGEGARIGGLSGDQISQFIAALKG